MLADKIKKIPDSPGIYEFKDKTGKLLYIGKAKSLKKRVSSYFIKNNHNIKTAELIKRIADIEIITTKNEIEAFLLEANLIQQNQPPYNIDLKSGSGRYAYLKITKEKFPRVVVARHKNDFKGGKIFGPYVSAAARREAQYWANAILKLRVCNVLPKQACLLYHINLCSAPCIGKISDDEYQTVVRKAEQFLGGQTRELKEILEREMREFSAGQKYEQAKLRRDQILALERLQEKQNINLPKGYDQDVINYIITPQETVAQMFNIQKGIIYKREEFHLANGDVSEFLRRYYEDHKIPEEIILPQKFEDEQGLRDYLNTLSERKIIFTIPQQGAKKELLDLLRKNLEISASAGNAVLVELQQTLNLPTVPRVIEMFDITHTSGKEIVASMVRFSDSRPDKNQYRRFLIKTVHDNDDFASMREVVGRRYKKLLLEKKSLPDLIMVDGGRGQLSAALGVLQNLGISTPLAALAKKEEEIYTVGRRFPLSLPKHSEALKLIQYIRDEAHRFAVTFHRQRRSKKFLNKK